MADALGRLDSNSKLRGTHKGRLPDIRVGSVERVVAETQSKLRFSWGPLSYERIRRTQCEKSVPDPAGSKAQLKPVKNVGLSVAANAIWDALKALFTALLIN